MISFKNYDEEGNSKADTCCEDNQGVHHFYIVVMAGRWIQYDNGDWYFKIDNDRMGRAIDVELITGVDMLKQKNIEEYGLIGASLIVELSYWLHGAVSAVTDESQYPLQISNPEDFKIFTSVRKVDKSAIFFVTFREIVDGKLIFLRPRGCVGTGNGVDDMNELRVGSTSGVVVGEVDAVTGNEMEECETDVLDDDTIMRHVEEIEAVYAAKSFELSNRAATASKVEEKVDNKDCEVQEDDEEEEEDNEDEDDGKDGEGGADGRTNTKYVGMRGEMAPKTGVGAKSVDKSSRKGSGSAGKKQRT
ncbi:hypothetical protein F2Q70_00036169 [Brassica cretica]|uniref:Uncharacterized protein n=1 Tax=Brassica cretica TaxID=69181 RepID=A0A8S9JWP4_BRACR|nr:hypothetical protein F2Q70_00036169 [Brassica cretica]